MKTWTVTVDDREHRVDYSESLMGAGAKIVVDGLNVDSKLERKLFAQTWRHIFSVNGHPFVVRVANEVHGPVYSFGPLGEDSPPTNAIPAWSIFFAAVASAPAMLITLSNRGHVSILPPIIRYVLEGALLMGIPSAFIHIARQPGVSVRKRILRCAAVALGLWIVAGLLSLL